MITLERPAFCENNRYAEYCGLSTDNLSSIDANNGDEFYEIDTGNLYKYDESVSGWIVQPKSGGGSGTGAVESVNGKTGTVVLNATDVGALPNTITIPTKTSQLTNDSGFVDKTYVDTNSPVTSVNGKTGTVVIETGDFKADGSVEMTGNLYMGAHAIMGVKSISDAETGLAIESELSMNNHKITDVLDPTEEQDAVTKKYLETLIAAQNTAISGLQTTISSLQSSIADLEKRIEALETTNE